MNDNNIHYSPTCNNDGSTLKYNIDDMNRIGYKFLCNNDDDLSENNSAYNIKLNNTKRNNMINNNNVDYYSLYENDHYLIVLCNNEGCLVACNMKLINTKRDDCVCALYNNEVCFDENNDADTIKCTNNKSSLGNDNNVKHNDTNNDNNIDYNPPCNNDGCLVKYDYIYADDIEGITKTNVDNNTEANSRNEQKTIKICTNSHNEWLLCFVLF